MAQRFGSILFNLELLPRPDVEIVTGANLLSRFMGNTGPNVVDAMRRAKGGILFIDEVRFRRGVRYPCGRRVVQCMVYVS